MKVCCLYFYSLQVTIFENLKFIDMILKGGKKANNSVALIEIKTFLLCQ